MKKQLVLGLALLFVPFISSAAGFETNLKYGTRGQAVTELQEFLISKGDLGGTATGNFYSLTLAAVKKFQVENNLPSTGYFGPMSRAIANQILEADLKDSNDGEVQEIGTTTPVASVVIPTPVTNNTNAINQLNQKIDALTTQLQTQQNTQNVGAVTPVVVPVDKKVVIQVSPCKFLVSRTVCVVEVQYFENNNPTNASIQLSANDAAGSINDSGTAASVANVSYSYFNYYPSTEDAVETIMTRDSNGNVIETAQVFTRTLTATVNGVSTEKTFTDRIYNR